MFGWNCQGDFGPVTMYTAADKGLVVFLKAPPRCPPTPNQTMIRGRFKRIATTWATLTQPQRDQWEELTIRACLRITGYDLFTYYQMRRDVSAVETLEHQTGIKVTKPDYIALS